MPDPYASIAQADKGMQTRLADVLELRAADPQQQVLLVEHIVETADWMSRLLRLLELHDVFFVGLHCPLVELERRERTRGDRRIGEARADFEITHSFCLYDLEIRSTDPTNVNVKRTIAAWKARRSPTAFERMAASHGERPKV